MKTLALLAGLALAGAAAGGGPKVQPPLSKPAYEAAKAKLEAQYAADAKLCGSLEGHTRKVCEAEAKGRHESLRAELQARYKPGADARQKAKIVTADANFDVGKVKCEAFRDRARDRCLAEARAAREAAIRQAKVEKVQETGGPFASSAHKNPRPGTPS